MSGTKKRKRRNRTDEILNEATRLLSIYGFQGMTLAKVAESVGLTEPGLLHYFPSKVHLLQGVLEHRQKAIQQQYAEMIESDRRDVAELFANTEAYWTQDRENPELLQLFAVLAAESIRHDHPSHNFFVEQYRRGREIYRQQILSFTEQTLRPDVDPEQVATLIMAMMDGLRVQWLLDPERVDLSATFGLFSKIMVAYLK